MASPAVDANQRDCARSGNLAVHGLHYGMIELKSPLLRTVERPYKEDNPGDYWATVQETEYYGGLNGQRRGAGNLEAPKNREF